VYNGIEYYSSNSTVTIFFGSVLGKSWCALRGKREQNKKMEINMQPVSSCSTTPACKQQWENQNQLLFEALKLLTHLLQPLLARFPR
jgi:hypothetical protein